MRAAAQAFGYFTVGWPLHREATMLRVVSKSAGMPMCGKKGRSSQGKPGRVEPPPAALLAVPSRIGCAARGGKLPVFGLCHGSSCGHVHSFMAMQHTPRLHGHATHHVFMAMQLWANACRFLPRPLRTLSSSSKWC
eukprot:357922-Chlamydomonas_euryale.AAC.3